MPEYAEFNGTPEEAESFLNENMELAKSWILKHVPRKTLETWLAEKRLTVRGSEQQSISIRESVTRHDSSVEGNAFLQARYSITLAPTVAQLPRVATRQSTMRRPGVEPKMP